MVLCGLIAGGAFAADPAAIDVGGLAAFILASPRDVTEREYLGVSGLDSFTIPQIRAEVIIVEIFSMYCPYCQKEAPRVNELYRMIEDRAGLRGTIKVIGIGSGNSAYEVGVFKKTYQIPFPLFADDEFRIHKICGEVRTPFFMALRINADRSLSVIHSHVGGFESPSQFLDHIIHVSGIKKG